MTQHTKQDKAARTTAAQPKPWSVPERSNKPTSSANDNDGGPYRSERARPHSKRTAEVDRTLDRKGQTAFATGRSDRAGRQPRSRSSWRGTLGVVTYAVGTSIAMFGWIYVLWSAFAASVLGILH
jgi:hypothetical protein